MQAMQTGLDLGWTGSQVRGARCPVSKFMDLFDTALQVHVPTVHFTLKYNLLFNSWFFLIHFHNESDLGLLDATHVFWQLG